MRTAFVFLAATLSAWPQAEQTVLRTGTNEIVVDVVVRDRKGKIARNLKAADFAIEEDGVPQPVMLMREFTSAASRETAAASKGAPLVAAPYGAPAAAPRLKVERRARLVSIVFDRLGQDGRRLATRAALDFLDRDYGDNVFYAVFAVDHTFRAIQPYTSDRERLRSAIRLLAGVPPTNYGNSKLTASVNQGEAYSQNQALEEAVREGNSVTVATNVLGGANGNDSLAALAELQMRRTEANFREFTVMEGREQSGQTSVFALFSLVHTLQRVAGRKSVLYFSEGLTLPNGIWPVYEGMLAAAMRAGVSVYAIDARGLSLATESAMARAILEGATERSGNFQRFDDYSLDERFQSRTFDIARDSMRAAPQNTLRELAESTGGFLIANTNDLRQPLKRLSEDFNSYYELTYRPSNQNWDGRFRKIVVKLADRPDALVQAKPGYFAMPPFEGGPLMPFEVPLLNALSGTPPPKELEFQASVIPYGWHGGERQAQIVFDLPLRNVTFARDPDANQFRTHISVLSLIKDEKGQVVSKLSRDVPLNEPPDRVDQFRRGRFIVSRPVKLPPGRYVLESVAADQLGQRAGTRRSVLTVAAPRSGPMLSGLAVLRRMDRPAERPDPEDAYHLPEGRVVPTLANRIALAENSELQVFLKVFPDDAKPAPSLIFDLLREGKLVRRNLPRLAAAAGGNGVSLVARTPLYGIPAGNYEVRATLVQGDSAVQQMIPVVLE